jgi:hypothetical protein
MSLSEVSVIDKIEVLLHGQIQVRVRNQILKDGKEIAATFSRHCLCPGEDLSGQDPKVVAIAEATWTPEVVAEYQNLIASNQTP